MASSKFEDLDDPFDTLDNPLPVTHKQYKIPDCLHKKTQNNLANRYAIPFFEYDITNECFYFKKKEKHELKTLFFERWIEENENKQVIKNFFGLKFCEKAVDDSILHRDVKIEDILKKGICFNKHMYNIVGCSNSQVQKKSFIFMKGSRQACDNLIKKSIPNIQQIEIEKGVAKRVKYTGLLFTSCQNLVKLPSDFRTRVITDYKNRKYNFTDGCGLISIKLATDILEKNPALQKKWKGQIPSIWQIRFFGSGYLCKGVVIIDHGNTSTALLSIRQSMIKLKVSSCENNYFGIVDTSLNHKLGKLNKQLVTLLSTSDEMRNILIGYQKQYISSITKARSDPESLAKGAAFGGQWQSFKKILFQHEIETILPKAYTNLVRSIESKYNDARENQKNNKMNVPMVFSQLLFGAAFPELVNDELDEGQCVVCTDTGLHEGYVIVSRSPSYSPSDVRVLQAIKPTNKNSPVFQLRNVILFATKGKRPEPDKMSGGDLDGDMYLVIWEPLLLDYKEQIGNCPLMDYQLAENEATRRSNQEKEETRHAWISYVAKWENSMLAQIDSCFYYNAGKYGIKSKQCQELCDLFSRAVDQNPSDITKLKKYYSECIFPRGEKSNIHTPDCKKPVWEEMEENYKDFLKDLQTKREKFPSKDDWKRFYNDLIYVNEEKIERILYSTDIIQCVNLELIDQAENYWKKICKGEYRDITPTHSLVTPCIFDCENKKCEGYHSVDPKFYNSEWRSKSYNEIMKVIADTKAKVEEMDEEIKLQENFRQQMYKMDEVANRDYEKKLEIIKYKIKAITKLSCSLKEIWNLEKLRDGEKMKIKEPNEWNIFVSYFWGERKLSDEERTTLETIEKYDRELVHLYNRLCAEEDVVNDEFCLFSASLKLKFDSIPNQKYCDERKNDISSLINKTYKSKHILPPKFEIMASSVENVSKLRAIVLSEIVNMEAGIEEKNIAKRKLENEVKQISCKINKIDLNEEQLQKHVNEVNEIKYLCAESIYSLDADQTIQQIVTWIYNNNNVAPESTLDEVVNTLTSGENEQKSVHMLSFTMPKILNKHLQNVTIESQSNVSQKKTLVDKKRKVEEDLVTRQNELETLFIEVKQKNDIILSYVQMREHVYDPTKHKSAMDEYHKLDPIVKGFDLALCALYNEVDERFDVSMSKINDKDRVAFAKELNLCIQREKKRCQKELSENNLPVFSKRSEILEALRENDAVVVVAQTGSGKSTQVPQYLADDLHHVLEDKRFPTIACTQPRRVACIRIAERVSMEYAGAVDVPVRNGLTQEEKTKPITSTKRVSAYPLYAKLSQKDQDRALDDKDREGFHIEYHERVDTKNQEDMKDGGNNLSGTAGEVGQWVGFHIGSKGKSYEEKKKSRRICEKTRIQFVTEGLLLQKLKTSNDLQYDCIIIDEAHERGKDTDLLLAHCHDLLKRAKEKPYKGLNLKVIVMSASIDKNAFSKYLNGCPIVECIGRMFDVKECYIPPPIVNDIKSENAYTQSDSDYDSSWDKESDEKSNKNCDSQDNTSTKMKKPDDKKPSPMNCLINHAVDVIFNNILPMEESGDILVFLPGQGEIHKCVEQINERAEEESKTYTDQNKHFEIKKVVCCTNIAETSLTIPGVRFVLDAGKAKQIKYNHKLRVETLRLVDTSQASAKQRKGRAGRVQTGWCFRLYSEDHMKIKMPDYDEPQMKQTSIDELYLYALDVFKKLEKINFMADARPALEAIHSARKRLLNLGYVDDYSDKPTDDGKFALAFLGELSLEGAKMVLESRRYNLVNEAITLAVLLEENIFTEREANEHRLKYNDELGDHLTMMNLYLHFDKRIRDENRSRSQEATKDWCKKLDLNFGILNQVYKYIDSVYQTIKRMKNCDMNQCLLDKKEKNANNPKRNKRNKREEEKYMLVENRENLLKIVVAGYFHNISLLHDPMYIKSGYSLLTPSNYGDEPTSDDVNLLKLTLSRDSTLMQIGDVTQNKATVFRTLFQTQDDGPVYMITASKIKAEWIEENSNERWRSSIDLQIFKNDIVNSFVNIIAVVNSGPAVLARIVKQTTCDDKLFLKDVENTTNARIRCLFDTAEVKIYGSKKETDLARNLLEPELNAIKCAMIAEDYINDYPNPEGKQPICSVTTGLEVSSILRLPQPQIHTDWNQVASATMIFTGDVPKQRIETTLKKIQTNLPDNLKEYWDEPFIIQNQNTFAKVEFKCQLIAFHVDAHLKNNLTMYGFSRTANCFLDRQISIKVIDTQLYPTVSEHALNYANLILTEKNRMFQIRPVKKPPRYDRSIDELVEDLKDMRVFGSVLMEDIFTSLSTGVKEFIFWKMKKLIPDMENDHNVKITHRKKPTPKFEIFGEYKNRTDVYNTFESKIIQLNHDVSHNGVNYTRTYVGRIPIGRNIHANILGIICNLRDNYNDVQFPIMTDGLRSSSTASSVVLVLSDNAVHGERAKNQIETEINALSTKSNVDQDVIRCGMCLNRLYNSKSSKQKKNDRAMLKEARKSMAQNDVEKIKIRQDNDENLPVAFRFSLCGCTYCKKCFKLMVEEQLNSQSSLRKHEPITCLKCEQVVLLKDINWLSNGVKDRLYEQALTNYLLSRNDGTVDKCGSCYTLLFIKNIDKGFFKCYNEICRHYFCCKCHGRLINEADFEQHKQCREQRNFLNFCKNIDDKGGKCSCGSRPSQSNTMEEIVMQRSRHQTIGVNRYNGY